MLDLRLGDQADFFALEVAQGAGHGDARALLVGPDARRAHLHAVMGESVDLSTEFLYSLPLVASGWFVIIR